MTKEYYFLFSKGGLPLAIFLTETAEESKALFCKLYRRSWEEIEKAGSYMMREKDVPAETWDEIHEKYKARDKKVIPPKPPVMLQLPKKSVNPIVKPEEHGTTHLETEKYLRPQW